MATITGTNGNDQLTGTSGDDVILPLHGHDRVDGGAGIDLLKVNYANADPGGSFTTLFTSNIASDGAGGFAGIFTGGNDRNSVTFSDIEKILFAGGGRSDDLTVDAASLATAGRSLSLDGGAGNDHLTIDFSALDGDTNFAITGTTVASNRGAYSNWEQYTILLGGGVNSVMAGDGNDAISGGSGTNNIDGGAGDDIITSIGADQVDGGAGFNDHWIADYSRMTTALNVQFDGGLASFHGRAGSGSVTGAGFAGSTAVNVESAAITTGSGDDDFVIGAGRNFVDGGAGIDSLSVDYSPDRFLPDTGGSVHITSNAAGSFDGSAADASGNYGIIGFQNIEKASILLPANSAAFVDATALGLDHRSLTIATVDGFLVVDFSKISGDLTYSNGVSNYGNYLGFSRTQISLGDGKNTVTTGVGDDIIRGGTGTNNIDTGNGADVIYSRGTDMVTGGGDGMFKGDTLNVDYTGIGAGSISASTIDYDPQHDQSGGHLFASDGSRSVQYSEIENVNFTAGDGDDSLTVRFFTIGGSGTLNLGGGAGNDTLTLDFGALATATNFAVSGTTATSDNGNGHYAGWESYHITLGGGDDDATGGTGDDWLDGGDGNDLLSGGEGRDVLIGYNGIDTASYAGAASGVTVDLAITRAQNTHGAGIDHLVLIENLVGSGFDDQLAGNRTANQIDGGAGNDMLAGEAGNDSLIGGAGDDLLTGGAGRDTLTGGAGADRFVFAALADSTAQAVGRDMITDFDGAAGDCIDLSAIDARTGFVNDKFVFIGDAPFGHHATDLRVVADGDHYLVQGDVNGDAVADFAIVVVSATSLTAADFIL